MAKININSSLSMNAALSYSVLLLSHGITDFSDELIPVLSLQRPHSAECRGLLLAADQYNKLID